MNPTDEVRDTSLEARETEPVEPKLTTPTGVKEKRARISTKTTKFPGTDLGTLIALITVVGIIVASYVSLRSKVEQIDSLVTESKANTEKIRDNLTTIRERVAQLEVKLDTMHLTSEQSERYSRDIESIKVAMADMQAQSKELKEIALKQVEQRIEQIENNMSRDNKQK